MLPAHWSAAFLRPARAADFRKPKPHEINWLLRSSDAEVRNKRKVPAKLRIGTPSSASCCGREKRYFSAICVDTEPTRRLYNADTAHRPRDGAMARLRSSSLFEAGPLPITVGGSWLRRPSVLRGKGLPPSRAV